jgi:hypothetical protein
VAASLTSEQKAYLAQMKFGDFNTWPDLDERDAPKRPRLYLFSTDASITLYSGHGFPVWSLYRTDQLCDTTNELYPFICFTEPRSDRWRATADGLYG